MQKIKFRHYRLVPSKAVDATTKKPYVLVKSSYGINMTDWAGNPLSLSYLAHGGATYVAIYEDGELMKEAITFCSPEENFSRAKGREYAIKHLDNGMPSDYRSSISRIADVPQELRKFVGVE